MPPLHIHTTNLFNMGQCNFKGNFSIDAHRPLTPDPTAIADSFKGTHLQLHVPFKNFQCKYLGSIKSCLFF